MLWYMCASNICVYLYMQRGLDNGGENGDNANSTVQLRPFSLSRAKLPIFSRRILPNLSWAGCAFFVVLRVIKIFWQRIHRPVNQVRKGDVMANEKGLPERRDLFLALMSYAKTGWKTPV